MGIKLGKALHCEVTAISRGEWKRSLAMHAGADRYIASSAERQMANNAGTLDLIINTIPTKHDPSVFTRLLAPQGQHIFTGAHASAFAAGAVSTLLPGRTNARMTYIGGVAITQEVMDICARAGILTEIEVRPVADLNRIFERLDGTNESGVRFVLDVSGSLGRSVSTGRATRLQPSPLLSDSLQEIANEVMEQLTTALSSPEDSEVKAKPDVLTLMPARTQRPEPRRGEMSVSSWSRTIWTIATQTLVQNFGLLPVLLLLFTTMIAIAVTVFSSWGSAVEDAHGPPGDSRQSINTS